MERKMIKKQYDFLFDALKEKEKYNPFDQKQNSQAKELKEACDWLKNN